MKLASVLVWLTAAIFFIYGLAFGLWPETLSQMLTGGGPSTSSGWIDIRATYGGMSVGVGLLLGLLALGQQWRVGLQGVLVLMGGMAGMRLLGIFADGQPNDLMVIYLVAELVGAAVAVFGLDRLPKGVG